MAGNVTTPSPIVYSFWEQIHSGFLVLVVLAAVFGNSFVCMAVYKVRRLQKVSNYYLVSLAISDILFALLSTTFRAYFEINKEWSLGKNACKLWIFMDFLCYTASILSLSLISVDRYVALSQSLRYLVIATISRCRLGIAAVWLFSFTVAAFSFRTWSSDGLFEYHVVCKKSDKLYYTVITVLCIIIPLIVLIILYCLVFKIAFQQRVKIMQTEYITPPSSEDNHQLRPQTTSSPRKFAIRELKATKTLIIVVGAFLVCWLPLFVLIIMQQYIPQYINSMPQKTQEILGLLFFYSLPQFNSCLNPYIYACHNAEFRKVFKQTFGKVLPFLKKQSKNERTQFSVDPDFASTGI